MQRDWEPYSLFWVKGEIWESMMSRWRRGCLRIVLHGMYKAEKKMWEKSHILDAKCILFPFSFCVFLRCFLSLFFSELHHVKLLGFLVHILMEITSFGLRFTH